MKNFNKAVDNSLHEEWGGDEEEEETTEDNATRWEPVFTPEGKPLRAEYLLCIIHDLKYIYKRVMNNSYTKTHYVYSVIYINRGDDNWVKCNTSYINTRDYKDLKTLFNNIIPMTIKEFEEFAITELM